MDWEKSSHAPGQQTASWTMTHRFDVFLNNDREHPRGKFQTVSYALNAKFTPSPDNEHFFRMDRPGDKISSGWTNFGLTRISPERAWWTGQIEPRIVPSPRSPRRPTADKLVWQGSQPESVNSETQYSSGKNSASGSMGQGRRGT